MKRQTPRSKLSQCATCDAFYSEDNARAVNEHRHPEPQSGPPRDALIRSRLRYSEWVEQTPEGRAWLATDPVRGRP